ncbi:MAG TPA: DUF4115 domain-containing protein [Anaerolineae bacterium]|nr:DUF4115 domain-containing protein [Anaerolineae bacterium]
MSSDTTVRLGAWLRERREALGVDLQQAQAETRIRSQYIEALESEQYQALPDPTVGRGFVKNYASYLGLDVDEAARLYSAAVAPAQQVVVAPAESNPFASGSFQPMALHEIQGRARRWLWLVPVILCVAGLVALAWWQWPALSPYLAWLAPRSPTATVLVQAATNEAPTAAPTGTAPPSPESVTPEPTKPRPTASMTPTRRPSATPTTPIYTGIFLELLFEDRSWLQITVDGVRQFQGELEAGTYKSWFGEESIEVRIGNAGAVSLTLNGQKLGMLGAAGEVVERVFEKVGDRVSSGTPTPALTATRTLRTSPTPSDTPSPSPSPTLTHTPSPTP